MIPRAVLAVLPLALLLGASPGAASAQVGWEANVHAATLVNDLFEDGSNGVQAGTRLVYTTPWRFTLGGNFDWARLSDVGPGLGGSSADLLLYSAELGYAAPVSPRTDLLFMAGIGAATIRLRDVTPSVGLVTSSTGQLVPVGVAIRVRNQAVGASWAFRADVRDDIVFLDVLDPVSGEVDQEPRHNWELSAGISFLFGGGAPSAAGVAGEERPAGPRAEPPAERPAQPPGVQGDADRDGVPDRLDRCPRTPPELAVGATGCPIDMDRDGDPDRRVAQRPADRPPAKRDERTPPVEPAPPAAVTDTDRDGVADADDRCANTPRGAAVDERGCPVAPAAEPAPPDDGGRVEAAPDGEAAPAGEPPGDEAVAGEPPADEPPDRAAEATPAGACMDVRPWDRPGITIAFDGRLWEQLGPPEPITLDNLERVGEFDGVAIYVASVAREPYEDIWVPRCDGTYQLYVEQGSE